MKNLIFIAIFCVSNYGFTQITFDQSDMPSVGDYIPRRSDTMTVLPGPGGSGPNQVWNFTALSNNVISENTNVISVASTPNGNQFGGSNMAMTNDNANYLYFNKSAQAFTTQGYSGDLLGTGTINAQFSPDLTLHQFPRTFGSSFTDTYGIDVIVPGAAINPLISQIHFKRSSVVKDTTDAWGQITTPFGTYDVLRIHTMETYVDSVWAQPLFPPTWSLVSTSADTTHSYSWVGKGGKLAIAEMSFDTLGVPKIFKWTEMQGIAVGLTENQTSEIKITPNPTSSSGIISIQSCEIGEKFTLVNTLGKVVMEGCILTKPLELNLTNLDQGLYILTLGDKQARVIKQ
ncbi:MAG: T9SS type A sorting domain-containing protein [Flavobacteriales bacterium]|jgi:hypothetical protein